MTFDELAHCLEVEGFEESPAELHGLLSGRVAGGERLPPNKIGAAIVESLGVEEELVDNARDDLIKLYADIIAAFEDEAFAFRLLLPGDEFSMSDRVLALSEWCESFLSGLGESGLQNQQDLSDEVMTAISDLGAIAQVGYEDDDEEDEESDFVEIHEYVRMAAMVIYSELNFTLEVTASSTVH